MKYVGKTDNLRRRWNEHIRLNHSSCTALIRAMKKYGITNFKMYPIFTIKATTVDNFNCMLNTLESFYIKKYNTYKHGYNCTTGGEGSFGHIVSEEHHKKCSLGMKGKHHTKETCEKIRQALLNRGHSRNRKIAQYDINNNLIKIYTSKSEILNTLKMCLFGNIL